MTPLELVIAGLLATWLSLGAATVLAFVGDRPRRLLRLASLFLGVQGLLAVTVVLALLTDPGVDQLTGRWGWSFGYHGLSLASIAVVAALTAVAVLALAFGLNQLVGRAWCRLLRPRPLSWPAGLPSPSETTRLLSFDGGRRDAFAFSLIVMGRRGRWPCPHREDLILVSNALLAALTPDEARAVVAHELGHVVDLDGRYLTYVRTLASLLRADPILAWMARALTHREEIAADDIAVQLTGDAPALARALVKANISASKERPRIPSASSSRGSLASGGFANSESLVEERLQRLRARTEISNL